MQLEHIFLAIFLPSFCIFHYKSTFKIKIPEKLALSTSACHSSKTDKSWPQIDASHQSLHAVVRDVSSALFSVFRRLSLFKLWRLHSGLLQSWPEPNHPQSRSPKLWRAVAALWESLQCARGLWVLVALNLHEHKSDLQMFFAHVFLSPLVWNSWRRRWLWYWGECI